LTSPAKADGEWSGPFEEIARILLISEEYRRLNAELHARSPAYGTSGGKWARTVYSLGSSLCVRTVLDYGCGKGALFDIMRREFGEPLPFECLEYDPAIPGKEEKPAVAGVVVCGDVLEHIEPDCLGAVLDDIRDIARRRVLLVVATQPAVKTLADGRNAHLIVEPAEWWLPRLMARWRLRCYSDRGGEFLFTGSPK
jgi:hypothetical protein